MGTFILTTTSFPTFAAVIQDGVVATTLTAIAFGASKLRVVNPLPSHNNGFSSKPAGLLFVNVAVVTGLITIVPVTPPLEPRHPGPADVNV